jgi:hypothetical protein
MKIKNDRVFTDNHRKNYANYNNTDIFFAKGKEDNTVKRSLKRDKTVPDFKPKFSDNTAFSRRVKEFYKKDVADVDDRTSSHGYLETEFKKNNTSNNNGLALTPKEKKLLQLNPKLKLDDIRKTGDKPKFYTNNSISSKYDTAKSSKEIRTQHLNSNIFNDPVYRYLPRIKRIKSLNLK